MSTAVWVGAGIMVAGAALACLLRKPILQPGDELVLIGDSLSVGLGVTAAYGTASSMKYEAQQRGVTLLGLGEGATTALQWSGSGHLNTERLQPALARKPKAVIVVLGTNDCHYDYGHCDPKFGERILQIAKSIADAGAIPVLAAMPAMPWESSASGAARMAYARQAMKVAANAVGGVYIPAPEQQVNRWPDGIHPNVEGNRVWAKELMERLDRTKRWS